MSVLRQIFGPSRKEIWSQIADDIGGEYIDKGFWGKDCIVYKSGEWQIVLDTFAAGGGKRPITYTRLRAPFVNKDGLYFKIYTPKDFIGIPFLDKVGLKNCQRDMYNSIGKAMGMQDIIIYDESLDKSFVIQGNSEEKIKLIFQDTEFTNIISSISDISMCLEIKDDEGFFHKSFPEGVDELYLEVCGNWTDKEMIKKLFDLFSITLERLVQIDSAYEDDPNISLY